MRVEGYTRTSSNTPVRRVQVDRSDEGRREVERVRNNYARVAQETTGAKKVLAAPAQSSAGATPPDNLSGRALDNLSKRQLQELNYDAAVILSNTNWSNNPAAGGLTGAGGVWRSEQDTVYAVRGTRTALHEDLHAIYDKWEGAKGYEAYLRSNPVFAEMLSRQYLAEFQSMSGGTKRLTMVNPDDITKPGPAVTRERVLNSPYTIPAVRDMLNQPALPVLRDFPFTVPTTELYATQGEMGAANITGGTLQFFPWSREALALGRASVYAEHRGGTGAGAWYWNNVGPGY